MATRKVAISLYKSTEYRLQSAEYKANQILPRRRGSGSDAVADEGVEFPFAMCFYQLPPKIIPIFSSLFEEGQLYCFVLFSLINFVDFSALLVAKTQASLVFTRLHENSPSPEREWQRRSR